MVEHCVNQLTDEQVWSRDGSGINPIGNLVLHLAGNLRQWVVAGLGGKPDMRQRPQEFTERGPIPRQELLAGLRTCVEEAGAVLGQLSQAELLRTRRIQGFDMTAVAALGHAVPHFRGHTQEIVRATRQHLGPAYRFAWAPQTLEQGANSAI